MCPVSGKLGQKIREKERSPVPDSLPQRDPRTQSTLTPPTFALYYFWQLFFLNFSQDYWPHSSTHPTHPETVNDFLPTMAQTWLLPSVLWCTLLRAVPNSFTIWPPPCFALQTISALLSSHLTTLSLILGSEEALLSVPRNEENTCHSCSIEDY